MNNPPGLLSALRLRHSDTGNYHGQRCGVGWRARRVHPCVEHETSMREALHHVLAEENDPVAFAGDDLEGIHAARNSAISMPFFWM